MLEKRRLPRTSSFKQLPAIAENGAEPDLSTTQSLHLHLPPYQPPRKGKTELRRRQVSDKKKTKPPASQAYIKAQKDVLALYRAAKQGDTEALINLGFCYEQGMGVDKNIERAFRIYLHTAHRGLADAQYAVGVYYYNGIGVAKDESKAIIFLAKSALQEHDEALNKLGLCYIHGRGVSKDHDLAAGYFLLAAEKNNPKAQMNLANCYKNGWGVSENMQLAVFWYHQAFIRGLKESQDKPGILHQEAKQGQVKAQKALGYCYQDGLLGLQKSHRDALYYFQQAASQGDQSAIANIAKLTGIPSRKYIERQKNLGKELVNRGMFAKPGKNSSLYDTAREDLYDPRPTVFQERHTPLPHCTIL